MKRRDKLMLTLTAVGITIIALASVHRGRWATVAICVFMLCLMLLVTKKGE